MVIQKLDSIEFRLEEAKDFAWLKKYGTAFSVVDGTGSGCICFGMDDGKRKYFCKIAGVGTIKAEVSKVESVRLLKDAVQLYYDLAHPHLIRIVEEYDYKEFYVVVFEWANGECLFDHWNFDLYQKDPTRKSPKVKFKELPIPKKRKAVDVMFSFLQNVNQKGYVAVDFYDGSLLYDFETDEITICDIDLFEKAPVINNKGVDWFGTKRLKAPEEYRQGCPIDEQTNLFTLGALIFDFFGEFSNEEIQQRYQNNQFIPCSLERWQLNEESYQIALKAVNPNRSERYLNFEEFWNEWKTATAV